MGKDNREIGLDFYKVDCMVACAFPCACMHVFIHSFIHAANELKFLHAWSLLHVKGFLKVCVHQFSVTKEAIKLIRLLTTNKALIAFMYDSFKFGSQSQLIENIPQKTRNITNVLLMRCQKGDDYSIIILYFLKQFLLRC